MFLYYFFCDFFGVGPFASMHVRIWTHRSRHLRPNSWHCDVPFYNIGASARPMAVFSGFYESHGPTPSGDARGIVPAHRHGHRNKVDIYCIVIMFSVTLAAVGAILIK
jgi:hypothetical protein